MHRRCVIALLAALTLCTGGAPAADSPEPTASAGAGQDSRVSVLTAEEVIQILDDTVDWYRTLGTQQQNATQPSDLLILFANRQTADKVVALAFEIARANAELLSSEANAGQSDSAPSSPQALSQQQNQLDTQRQAIQDEINADRQRGASSGKAKQDIEAKLPELQGELAMVQARKNLLDTMAEFVNESNPKGAGANALKAHIDAIAATIPAASANPPSASPPGGSPSAASAATSPMALAPSTSVPGSGNWAATY